MKKPLFYSAIIPLFIFWSCDKRAELKSQRISAKNIQVEKSIEEDDSLKAIIEPYKSSIEDEMNKTLSYASTSMNKNDTPYNTAIGNMMADAVFEMANPVFLSRQNDSIDAVLLNHGGIRSGIFKGKITTRTAYQVMPFENLVVVAKLKGAQVKEMFRYLSEAKRAHPISNMSIAVDDNWNLKEYSIDGEDVIDSQFYYIATSDYLVNGGDNMRFFENAETIYQIDYKLRNLLIDYFQKKDTINPKADDRFKKI
jgi:2',3'-cyclic-nucleotide 2'-phosphodiesterase (5'-nucleotidase family)